MSDRKEELFQLVMRKARIIVEALDRMGLDSYLTNDQMQTEALETSHKINRLANEISSKGEWK